MKRAMSWKGFPRVYINKFQGGYGKESLEETRKEFWKFFGTPIKADKVGCLP
jgi:hypothetical protein